ncbi:Ula1p [Sporobolomyces salmoneus]|uniref:Ula1p n=1 Tax=Sporobolomyces salmoneus TaxID=183962 RepID=UPI0031751FB7
MTMLPPPVQDSVPLVPPQSSSSPSTTPSSARPDAHTQKYDRQLRLWASSGQTALENANILVVNSNSTATSTLKNLVLPGIGQFTLLDPEVVKAQDLGTNFFLEPSSIGQPRAQEAVKYLCELNVDVKGQANVSSLSDFLASSPTALEPYTLILAVDVAPPSELSELTAKAWQAGIPLIKVESYGFYGALSTQIEEICLVETHPESLIDLRLNAPFPELIQFAQNEFDYAKMDSAQHSHVPAVVILVKALEEWKSSHGGKGPEGTKERKEFLELVMKEKRKGSDEENFDEAVGLYRRAGNKRAIPEDIEKLFNDDSCRNLTAQSSNFWVLLHTLQLFTQHPSNPSHLLPLTGSLPDMKAHSTTYVQLQQIYRAKAKADLDLFQQLLSEALTRLGGTPREIGKEEVESFVKHSAWVKVLRGRKLNDSIEPSTSLLKGKINELLEQASWSAPPDQSLPIYLALLTSSRFYSRNSRYPGSWTTQEGDADGTKDVPEMAQLGKELLKELGFEGEELPEPIEKAIREVCRSSHSTLPQTSALLGGLVAQESIKLVTKQYVPLVGETCIWDGITSMTGRVKA